MWYIFIVSALLKTVPSEIICGGAFSEVSDTFSHGRNLIARSSTRAPVRVLAEYINFDLGTPDLNTEFTSKVMDAAVSFYTNTLSIYSVIGNLIVTGGTCGSLAIPSVYSTVGAVNTDIIALLTTTTSSSYTGSTSICQLDGGNLNNPILGAIKLSSVNYQKLNLSSKISVITHEFIHLFGFISSIFKYWRNSAGKVYTAVTAKEVIRGVNRTIIITPNVVQVAKEIFQCDSINGLELENYPSSSSHWDKRIMFNEFMTSITSSDAYWSSITLALMQDTGWYGVNYQLATKTLFGTGSGCSFIYNNCVVNGVSSDSSIFCDTAVTNKCDFHKLHKASCKIVSYSTALPTVYQYFSSSTTGGSDIYTEYCPYYNPYSNGACRGNSENTYVKSGANEVIGITSRCFISTLSSSIIILDPYSACYSVTACNLDSAEVTIDDTNKIICPFTGGTFTVPGYSGTITCPDSNILCENVPCVNMCFGRGTCINGYCQCFSGYSGNDCSVIV